LPGKKGLLFPDNRQNENLLLANEKNILKPDVHLRNCFGGINPACTRHAPSEIFGQRVASQRWHIPQL